MKNQNYKRLRLTICLIVLMIVTANTIYYMEAKAKAGNAATVAASSTYSVFTTQTTDSVYYDGPYELGMKFQSTEAGQIIKIRYYKMTGDDGDHTGNLWSVDGTKLASATFSGETGSGWQEATLGTPYSISANTIYVVSVNTVTNYAAINGGLASTITNGPLSSIADGANGVYGDVGVFPINSWETSNYFRDVVFSTSASDIKAPTAITKPVSFELSQNYPNPFNPSTVISYQLSVNSHVKLSIYNVLGIEVRTLVNEEKSVGNYEVKFDANELSSGIYFYKMQAGEFMQSKKMLLTK